MTLSLTDFLTLAGLVITLGGPAFWYMKRRVDTLTENHLSHIDGSIKDVADKVDAISADVKLLTGRIEGWDLDARVTQIERSRSSLWNK